jgi:hypothetical protein
VPWGSIEGVRLEVPYILGWVFEGEEEEERPWFYGVFFTFYRKSVRKAV